MRIVTTQGGLETPCEPGTEQGSATARGDLISAVNGDMINVGFSPDRTKTNGSTNEIWFSPSQVDRFVANTPGELNSETLGMEW